jgi:hypothetical protein
VEGPHHGDGVSDFQRTQVALHSGPRDADGAGDLGGLELSAALAQYIFKQRVEAVHIPEAEEPLDVFLHFGRFFTVSGSSNPAP